MRCWSVDLDVSVLDQQLKLFVSRHSAFLSEDVPGEKTPSTYPRTQVCGHKSNHVLGSSGQRTLHHRGDVLDTQVVLNPSLDFVCSEVSSAESLAVSLRLTRRSCSQVQQLLSSPSRHKLLILAGQFVEESGDLVFQKGQFSLNHLLHIFKEEEVSGDQRASA